MYAPEKEALVWKIRNFPGGKEYLLRCKFGLPSVAAEEEASGRMPPIRVGYEIPYFTVSGIQARCRCHAAGAQTCLRWSRTTSYPDSQAHQVPASNGMYEQRELFRFALPDVQMLRSP